MRTKLQLELLRKLRQRKGLAKGFTLIELMIVVAIVGILAAVGIPKFVDVRDNADAGAKVGEVVGLAKECAVFVAAGGLGSAPTPTPVGTCTTSGGEFSKSWSSTKIVNLKCLTASATEGDTTATVTVGTDGGMGCSFS
jgi:prepilin-type N-terminal cleavage/methylation domain-containing protein